MQGGHALASNTSIESGTLLSEHGGPIDTTHRPKAQPMSSGPPMQPMGSAPMHVQAMYAPPAPTMNAGGWPHYGLPAPYHLPDQDRYMHHSQRQYVAAPGPPHGGQPPPGTDHAVPEMDPSLVGASASPDGDTSSGDAAGKKGGGRVLKQTRRAEQNRLAQRAFRERKDLYIRELEGRSKALDELQAVYTAGEAMRAEVEERARALAERDIALDARERNLAIREATAHPNGLSFAMHPSAQSGGPNELNAMRDEVFRLRTKIQEHDSTTLALRRALEDVSTDNGRLRRQLETLTNGHHPVEVEQPSQTPEGAVEEGAEPGAGADTEKP